MSATAFQRMRRVNAAKAVNVAPRPRITPEAIRKMDREQVMELLEAHGVEGATGKLSQLRTALIEVMFVEGV